MDVDRSAIIRAHTTPNYVIVVVVVSMLVDIVIVEELVIVLERMKVFAIIVPCV